MRGTCEVLPLHASLFIIHFSLLYKSHSIDFAHLLTWFGDKLHTNLLLALQHGGWDFEYFVLELGDAIFARIVDRSE